MSRRKQSNPKPLKRPSDEDSEDGDGGETTTARIKREIELPPDILELQPCNEEGRDVAVCGAIRLPKGSSFGPFIGEPNEGEDQEVNAKGTVIEFTNHEGKAVMLRMGENGRWLSLLKKKDENTANCEVYYDGDEVWCEILREILIHSELTAVFNIDNPDASRRRTVTLDNPQLPDTRPRVNTEPVSPLTPPHNSPVPTIEETSPAHPLIYHCPFCAVRFSSPRTLDAHVQFYCSKKPTDLLLSPECHLQPSHFSPTSYKEGTHAVKGHVRSSVHEKGVVSEDERSLDSVRCSPVSSDRDTSERQPNKDLLNCQFCPYSCWSISSLTRHKNKIHGIQQKNCDEQHATLSARDMFCQDCNIQFSSMSTFRGHRDYYCPKRSQETDSNSSISPSQRSSKPKASPQPSPENTLLVSPTYRNKAVPTRDGPMYPGLGGIVVPTQFLSPSIPISVGNQPAVLLAAPILASGGLANITMPAIIMQPVVNNRESSPCINQRATQRSEKSPVKEKSPDVKKEKLKEETELPLDLSTKSSSRTSVSDEESERFKSKWANRDHSEDTATDLSLPTRRSSEGERKSNLKHSNRHNSGGITLTNERHTPVSSKSVSRGSSESNGAVSPHIEVTSGNPFPASNHYLMYDQLGPPYVHNQFIPNPAFLYGRMQSDMVHGDSRLNSTSPHVSKCQECNIVFFKHENFLIHKKHYCASRKRSVDQRPEDSVILHGHAGDTRGVAVSSPTSLRKNGPDNKTIGKNSLTDMSETKPRADSGSSPVTHNKTSGSGPHLLYYCNACSIKFSSADTLQAHKEFYCSKIKLKNSHENSTLVPREDMEDQISHEDDEESKAGLFSCSECNNSYPSARLLKLHFCNTSQSKASLLRCLYCDFVAQTENKYVDHMKAHAPSKVYRCALCGYRGNTIRGMRMHGKMHVDQGSEFTDEDMLEFEEPPQIPPTLVSGSGVGPIDVEAELIRMKNEPYKRRRSRKSYEKSEYSPTPKKHGRHVCPVCYGVYPDSVTLSDHMQMHLSSSKYMCRSCEFTTDNKSALIEHMLTRHDNSRMKRETSSSDRESPKIKTEKRDDQMSSKMSSPREISDNTSKESSNDLRASTPRSSSASPALKERKRSQSPVTNADENGLEEHAEKENVPLPIPSCVSALSRPSSDLEETILSQDADKLGPKYCKSCDINFTFLSSFLAHKRYYCSGVCPREREGDSLSNGSLTRQQH